MNTKDVETELLRNAFEYLIEAGEINNSAKVEWIGHSYANAYMAAQFEGFKAAVKFMSQSNVFFADGDEVIEI